MRRFLLLLAAIIPITSYSLEIRPMPKEDKIQEITPHYLYKVLDLLAWKESLLTHTVITPESDRKFIHLAKEDQLDRVIHKYWKETSAFVILKIDSSKLIGKLIYETNPGGSAKYYHLYNGYIPIESVVSVDMITQEVKAN